MKFLSLLVLLLTVWMPAPVAAETALPPFAFAVTETLPLTDQDQTAHVVILNNTTQVLTLTLRLSELLPANAITQPVSSPFSLAVAETLTLAPAGQFIVPISVAVLIPDAPGNYSVYLMASTQSPPHVARRLISLTRKDKENLVLDGRLSATVPKWTMTLIQNYPFGPPANARGEYWINAELPVQMTGTVTLPVLLTSTLAGSNSGAIVVNAHEISTGVTGWLAMPLVVSSTHAVIEPGNYIGNIDVGKDSKVELTVVVKHHWLLPVVIVLIVVLLVSNAVNRYTNVLAKVWELRARLDEAYKVLAPEMGSKITAVHPHNKLVVATVDADIKSVTELKKQTKLDVNGEEYKTVHARITLLMGLADAWTNLPATQEKLKKALDDVEKALPNPPENALLKPPRFIRDAKAWLGATQLSLEAWTKQVTDMDNTLKVASMWLTLFGTVDEAWQRIRSNPPSAGCTDETRAQWEDDMRNSHRLRMSLWQDSASQLTIIELIEQVTHIQKNAYGWSKLSQVEQPNTKDHAHVTVLTDWSELAVLTVDAKEHRQPVTMRSLGDTFKKHAALWRGKIQAFLRSGIPWRFFRWLGSVFLLIVAAFIAAATALQQYYFAKPFGTPEDYINLIAWTAGVNAVVGGVLTALDRVLLRKES